MNQSWRIPAEVEKSFRDALGHASKRRLSELHGLLEELPEGQLVGAAGLCGLASAYTAIDVVERRWPTDDGLRRIAAKTVEGNNPDEQFGVTEENLYLWLAQCALGFNAYSEVFKDRFTDKHTFLAAPFFFTINVLATFSPKSKSVWEFLDSIENAYEAASLLDLNLLPALMVRARMPQPNQNPNGASS